MYPNMTKTTAIRMIDLNEETVTDIEIAHATVTETGSDEIEAVNIEEIETTMQKALAARLAAKMVVINQDVEVAPEMATDIPDVTVMTTAQVVITIADAHVLQTIDITDLAMDGRRGSRTKLRKIAMLNLQLPVSAKAKRLIFN